MADCVLCGRSHVPKTPAWQGRCGRCLALEFEQEIMSELLGELLYAKPKPPHRVEAAQEPIQRRAGER
jgi:hypothetical protein